jgi:hypothetical protein
MKTLLARGLALTLVALCISTHGFCSEAGDLKSIQSCLANWKQPPFDAKSPTFRTISSEVKVMGIGHDVDDSAATDKPELVLVKPNVSVMTKTVIKLMNPNGWYCLRGKVAVLGKVEVHLGCQSHLASDKDGATVLGSNKDTDGVTVLGASEVVRMGCK